MMIEFICLCEEIIILDWFIADKFDYAEKLAILFREIGFYQSELFFHN